MLPEKISNNLCSLNPNTKKLTLSCEIVLDENAEIISSKVYKSIISSKFRLGKDILWIFSISFLIFESKF